jgi:hypothetical protein
MMHILSTGRVRRIANIDGPFAGIGGSAREISEGSSPHFLCLQTTLLFVLLASVQEI